MIIDNYPWLKSNDLTCKIAELTVELMKHELLLDLSMDKLNKNNVVLKVVSMCDDNIIIVDVKSINTDTDSFVKTMKNRLQIIANHVEFLAFVVESVSKMKESDEHLLVGNLRFSCARKTDDGYVTFEFERGIYAFGGGTFNYCKAVNSVELVFDVEDLDTETTSVDISDLPKELELRLNLDHIDGWETLTVNGTFCKEYEHLTLASADELAKDFKETIRYLEKL